MLLVLWIPKRMSNGFQGSGRSDSALYAVSWLLKYFNLLVISKLIYTTAAQILLLQYCLKQGDNFFSHSVQRYLYLHSQFINQKRLQFSTVKKTHNCHHANSWTIFANFRPPNKHMKTNNHNMDSNWRRHGKHDCNTNLSVLAFDIYIR